MTTWKITSLRYGEARKVAKKDELQNEIEELRNKIKSQKTSDDVVEALIYKYLSMFSKRGVPKSREILQKTFAKLKLEKKYAKLFEEFVFDRSGITPLSDELDAVFFRIEASAVMSALNPTYKTYIISDSSREVLKASYDKFLPDTSLIDECANDFSKYMSEYIAEETNRHEETNRQ
jgi:hypothetical protein